MFDCKKLLIVAGFAALGAMTAAPAMAAAPVGFAGTFSGDYAHTSISNGGGSGNSWGFTGAGAFGFGNMDLGGQIDFGYHSLDQSGTSSNINIWNVGGSLFWAPMMGRFGGNFNYNSASFSGADFHFYNYGAIGEYYLSDQVTVALRAGGWSLDVSPGSFSDNGGYVGGALSGYLMPDLMVQGSIDYLGGLGFFGTDANITSLGVLAEYLFSESTPISVYGSYTYTDISCSGCGHASTWGLGFKFYTTEGPLVQSHRNGTLNYLSSPLALKNAL